ncbi:hypothetical protein C1645_827860 [Glomus cerebriforme]|uniref:Uncharacterized protein n=1 Tax=Glomus cerebriforme TaxID=658196 RepID=A0A397SWW8_9GLOM|nr:hypothetical protein C1645_827860 [Glomus cerebriforme]
MKGSYCIASSSTPIASATSIYISQEINRLSIINIEEFSNKDILILLTYFIKNKSKISVIKKFFENSSDKEKLKYLRKVLTSEIRNLTANMTTEFQFLGFPNVFTFYKRRNTLMTNNTLMIRSNDDQNYLETEKEKWENLTYF